MALRITLVSIVLACACSKQDKPDCDAYAERVASLGSPERAGSVKSVARSACERGEMPASEVRCVIAASSHDESLRCGAAKPKPTVPPAPRAHHLGLSVAIPAGWTDDSDGDTVIGLQADKNHGVAILRVPRSQLTGNPIASEEACRTISEKSRPPDGTTIEPAKLVETPQGKSCRARLKTATESVITETFLVGDDAIPFACVFGTEEADPPPGCKLVRDSLTLDLLLVPEVAMADWHATPSVVVSPR